MRNGLCVLDECVHVEVAHGVASTVVIHIIRDTGFASEQLLLFFRLDPLGASEEATSGDSSVEERAVV